MLSGKVARTVFRGLAATRVAALRAASALLAAVVAAIAASAPPAAATLIASATILLELPGGLLRFRGALGVQLLDLGACCAPGHTQSQVWPSA